MRCCLIVRCPGGSTEHALIKSSINYSLLLFDERLPDVTGQELAAYARTLAHRGKTPIIIFKKSENCDSPVKTIISALRAKLKQL